MSLTTSVFNKKNSKAIINYPELRILYYTCIYSDIVNDALRIQVYLVLQSACFFLLCFSIRKSTYLLLQTLQDTFAQQFEELTKEDPLYPLLQPYQIQDVTRRIKLLLNLVDYCVLYRGFDNVVKETFEN